MYVVQKVITYPNYFYLFRAYGIQILISETAVQHASSEKYLPPVWIFMSGRTEYAAYIHVQSDSILNTPMYLLSLMVFFRKFSSLSRFFQSYSFLFNTLVHRNATVRLMSGLPLFVIYNHLSVTICSVSLRFWSKSGFVSSNHSKYLAAGVDTFSLIYFPNIPIASSIFFSQQYILSFHSLLSDPFQKTSVNSHA